MVALPNKYLLTLHEVAEFLGVSWWSARRLLRREGLPFIVIGRQIMVRTEALSDWLEAREQRCAAPEEEELE